MAAVGDSPGENSGVSPAIPTHSDRTDRQRGGVEDIEDMGFRPPRASRHRLMSQKAEEANFRQRVEAGKVVDTPEDAAVTEEEEEVG